MQAVGRYVIIKPLVLHQTAAGLALQNRDPYRTRQGALVGELIAVGSTCKEIDLLLQGQDHAKFSGTEINEGDHVLYWSESAAPIDTPEVDDADLRIRYHCVSYDQVMARLSKEETAAHMDAASKRPAPIDPRNSLQVVRGPADFMKP